MDDSLSKIREACHKKKGTWLGGSDKQPYCRVEETGKFGEIVTRDYYPARKQYCHANGDIWMTEPPRNGDPFIGLEVCKQRLLNEYCQSREFHEGDIESCLKREFLPHKKIEQNLTGWYSEYIYKFQKIPSHLMKRAILASADKESNLMKINQINKLREDDINTFIRVSNNKSFWHSLEDLVLIQNLTLKNIDRIIDTVDTHAYSVFDLLFKRYSDSFTEARVNKIIHRKLRLQELVRYAQLKPYQVEKLLDNYLLKAAEVGGIYDIDIIQNVVNYQRLSRPQLMDLFKHERLPRYYYSLLTGHHHSFDNELLWLAVKKASKEAGNAVIKHALKTLPELSYEHLKYIIHQYGEEIYPNIIENHHPKISPDLRDRMLWSMLEKGTFRGLENPGRFYSDDMVTRFLKNLYRKEFGDIESQTGLSRFVSGVPEAQLEDAEYVEYYKQYGRSNQHPILHEIYEHFQLTPTQIDEALKLGYEVDQIYKYQHNFETRHIDYAIEHDINLDNLIMSDKINPVQRRRILEKMGIDKEFLKKYENVLDHPVWRTVSPRTIPKALKQYGKAVKEKTKDKPLDDITGVYPLKAHPVEPIIMYLKKRRMGLKKGDIKYAHYHDKDGAHRVIRLGKVLKRDPVLYNRWRQFAQYGVPEGDDTSNEEVMISSNPEHILAKSTGWKAPGFDGSCETIGSSHGIDAKCGWCDDIRYNNLIAVLKKKGSKSLKDWMGRVMIRWCKRKDDDTTDAVIEKFYGDQRYKNHLVNRVKEILKKRGYSAVIGDGNTVCETPYPYSGYADSDSEFKRGPDSRAHNKYRIIYHVGERPKGDINV